MFINFQWFLEDHVVDWVVGYYTDTFEPMCSDCEWIVPNTIQED